MPRRKERRLSDELFAFLIEAPWWAGPICIGAGYAFFRWAVPALFAAVIGSTDRIARPMLELLPKLSVVLSPWVAGFIVVAWMASLGVKLKNRQMFDRQTSAASIDDLSWREFERLIGDYYRRQGYWTSVTGSDCGDGGVDVLLERGGEKTLVQCKHWRVRRVDVKPVRELLGVMTSEKAGRGILVTTGDFTTEAEAFARQNGIVLVAGPQLVQMIRSAQQNAGGHSGAPEPAGTPATITAAPSCPDCGAQMLRRIARRGPHAGQAFWGCSRYPRCSGVREVHSPAAAESE